MLCSQFPLLVAQSARSVASKAGISVSCFRSSTYLILLSQATVWNMYWALLDSRESTDGLTTTSFNDSAVPLSSFVVVAEIVWLMFSQLFVEESSKMRDVW